MLSGILCTLGVCIISAQGLALHQIVLLFYSYSYSYVLCKEWDINYTKTSGFFILSLAYHIPHFELCYVA